MLLVVIIIIAEILKLIKHIFEIGSRKITPTDRNILIILTRLCLLIQSLLEMIGEFSLLI